MLINNYELPEGDKACLRQGNSADVLRENVTPDNVQNAEGLVVWRGAMKSPELEQGMGSADWVNKVFLALSSNLDLEWEARHSSTEVIISDKKEIARLMKMASGMYGGPEGNLVTTLNLRKYEDKLSNIGGREWWQEQKRKISISDPFVTTLLSKMSEMLNQAYESGVDFYVEQIGLILAKDKTSEAATLTPTLHSDEFYRFRETAVCSLLEEGFNEYGGTLFVPTIRMSAVEKYRPIKMAKLFELLPDTPIVQTQSGDVAYYGGMIGDDGKPSFENGMPHISPDLPGLSSRLIILMRNKRISWANSPTQKLDNTGSSDITGPNAGGARLEPI